MVFKGGPNTVELDCRITNGTRAPNQCEKLFVLFGSQEFRKILSLRFQPMEFQARWILKMMVSNSYGFCHYDSIFS